MTQYLVGAARQQLVRDAVSLYALDLTIQEVADQLGYSKTATRNMLLSAGVKLRSRNRPPVVLGAGVDPLRVGCPKCGAVIGQRCLVAYGRRARRTHDARKRQLLRAARHGA